MPLTITINDMDNTTDSYEIEIPVDYVSKDADDIELDEFNEISESDTDIEFE